MPCRIIEVDWAICDVRVSIPRLRIGWVGNQAIGLDKVVNIRRTRPLMLKKQIVKAQAKRIDLSIQGKMSCLKCMVVVWWVNLFSFYQFQFCFQYAGFLKH
jgi:hypothetical protein